MCCQNTVNCKIILVFNDSDITTTSLASLAVKPSIGDTLDLSSSKGGLGQVKRAFIKLFNEQSIKYCTGGFVYGKMLMLDIEEGIKLITLEEAVVSKVNIGLKQVEVTANVTVGRFTEYTEKDLDIYDKHVCAEDFD